MDFASLPDDAILKIFEYLPLENCIRAGRVSKILHRIAQLAIPFTKSLDLTKDCFENLTSDQLAAILDLCSPNLERIKFPSDHDWYKMPQEKRAAMATRRLQLATVFANYQCPRLIDIDLGQVPINNAVFEQLIRNNPRMENLVWYGGFVGFPDVTNNNLKKLALSVFKDAALQSLSGRCPNLKELNLTICRRWDDARRETVRPTADVLDQFFGSIPQVHQVRLIVRIGKYGNEYDDENENAYFPWLVNFWNLPLTSLSISGPVGYPGGDLFHKLITSFPHLQQLYLEQDGTDNIAALATLQELEILSLYGEIGIRYQGIRQLADCKKLQKLDVPAYVSGDTLIHLLQSCPQLGHVVIWEITEVGNPEEAAAILERLAEIAKRDIIIEFRTPIHNVAAFLSTWCVEPVFGVFGKLEENDGWKIKVTWHSLTDDWDFEEVRWLGITASLCATLDQVAAQQSMAERQGMEGDSDKVESKEDK